jgi:hypothetical protein
MIDTHRVLKAIESIFGFGMVDSISSQPKLKQGLMDIVDLKKQNEKPPTDKQLEQDVILLKKFLSFGQTQQLSIKNIGQIVSFLYMKSDSKSIQLNASNAIQNVLILQIDPKQVVGIDLFSVPFKMKQKFLKLQVEKSIEQLLDFAIETKTYRSYQREFIQHNKVLNRNEYLKFNTDLIRFKLLKR